MAAEKPPKKWVSYGYFVKLPNGQLVPSGHDFGATDSTYKKGDSMGVKNGKEGVVINVIKGAFAKRAGYDVLVVIEERPISSALN
jgi:hypothetical protein